MDVSSLPMMTKWQFYAAFLVQFVVGLLYCYAMYKLSERDPRLGWKPNKFGKWIKDKLFVILIVLAGIASYELLPDIYHALVADVVDVTVDSVTESIEKAADGTYTTPEIEGIDFRSGNAIWGQMNEQQYEAIMLMAGFWIFIGLFVYVGGFKASPVGFFKKIIKFIAYSCLTFILLFIPKDVHYFTLDEIMPSLVMLAIGVVGILVTNSGNKLPPPLPIPELENYNNDEDENDL